MDEISNVLNQYLIETKLSKIAYFTNRIPTLSESQHLTPYFSYVCFCAQSFSEQSTFLFNKCWANFKKVPFDVYVSPIEICVTARQFNFINLKIKKSESVKEIINFFVNYKSTVNKNYPVLLRIAIESNELSSLIKEKNLKTECEISSSDIIIRIDNEG